jgi:hypothetical protein
MRSKFEIIDKVQAEHLFKPISKETELPSILKIMGTQLFGFYMSQLKTGKRNLLYPGAGIDTASIEDIGSEFQKNYFVDKTYCPKDTHGPMFAGYLGKLANKEGLTLVYHDLKNGLPFHINSCFTDNGLKIFVPGGEGESVFQEQSIDVLIIKGLLLENFTKFRDQLSYVLHPNALIAVVHHCLSMSEKCEKKVWDESYNLASELSNLYHVSESVVPFDFSLPDEIAKPLQQKIDRPIKYLNQISSWYFFKKAEKS